jgi:hypothetical protein
LIRHKPEPKVEVEDENFGYLVPDKVKERVKDTAFLQRLRAMLVAAHSNENFIKELAQGNSY